MGLFLELVLVNAPSSVEWSTSIEAIAAYLDALRVNNRTVRDRVITRVLEAAMRRVKVEDGISRTTLSMEEFHRLMAEWFAEVLDEPEQVTDSVRLSARGRLALLLADMPGRWQEQFLQPAPWPPEFISVMRESFLYTRPDDHFGQMQPRPIDLGPIATLTRLGHLPYYRILLIWLGYVLLLAMVFRLTH